MRRIYLDNHTTTRPSPAAIAAMKPFLEEQWGVPSAPHAMGQELLSAMETSYRYLYRLLGAREEDTFIFTSSGAEAVNHVVHAVYHDVARLSGKNHFLTSQVDEAPVILAYERLERLDCATAMIPVNERGIVTPEALAEAMTPRTALFSLSWANALTGVIHPVAELAEVCRERGVLFHLEATHVLGKLDFSLEEISPDFLSFNGDHLHAPKSTGGLWVRSGLAMSPMIVGGVEQAGLRAGAVNVPALVALGIAAHEALEMRDELCTETARLRDRLEQGLMERLAGVQALFQDCERLPTTTTMVFQGVTSDALLFALNRKGVLASFGGGMYQQLSWQLAATGLPHPLVDSAISLSLSRFTTQAEIDVVIEKIVEVVRLQRRLSEDLVPVG